MVPTDPFPTLVPLLGLLRAELGLIGAVGCFEDILFVGSLRFREDS